MKSILASVGRIILGLIVAILIIGGIVYISSAFSKGSDETLLYNFKYILGIVAFSIIAYVKHKQKQKQKSK